MAASDIFIGRELGGFIVQERIGRGGMATVYRAFQPSVNRSVALKIITLDPNEGEKEEFRRRFAQEAKMIAGLEHIHILPIYDYGIVDKEVAYIAMRLLRGGSLSDLLHGEPLDMERIADIFTQIASGLAFAHRHGVIHRDLKPSNIMLDEAGNAYLTDFGLAKFIGGSLDLTRTGHIVGTPIYMSPEQLRGDPLDQRSDIYSMGVILYHMLVGKPPFDASDTNMVSVIYQHLEKDPTPPRDHVPSIPEAVETVAMKALRKDPARRYASVEEMASELNIALGRRSSTSFPAAPSAHPTPLSMPSVTRRRERFGLIAVAAAAVALIAIAALAFIVNQPRRDIPPPATVIAGETGSADDVIPSLTEVDSARRRLGDAGFVGYIACNQSSEYHATQAREMGDFARAYGLSYRIYDSDSDSYRQITEIEKARADGATALIVCPLDNSLIEGALTSAQAGGLPLTLLSSDSPSYGGVLIAGDDYLMGFEAGRAAGRIIRGERGGNATAIVLDFPSLPHIVRRADGLVDGVRAFAPNITIIGRYEGATRERGYQSVRDLIAQGVAFDTILSINDNGSYGAIRALEEAGIPSDSVIIASVDAEALARQHIANGYYMRASVDVGREAFSRAAVDATVRLLAGATLPETILVPPGRVVTRESLRFGG
jgi:serine/threonine protein kinase/DNA-binding LacI/PurR family transcriptional regulator